MKGGKRKEKDRPLSHRRSGFLWMQALRLNAFRHAEKKQRLRVKMKFPETQAGHRPKKESPRKTQRNRNEGETNQKPRWWSGISRRVEKKGAK